MLIENQKITVKVRSNNKCYYQSQGYDVSDNTKEIVVDARDLTAGSHVIVLVKCDYCGKIQEKQYCVYRVHHSDKFGDCCKDCAEIKQQQVMSDIYGVSNPSCIKEVQDKKKQTCLEHYGCENPSQSGLIKEKKKITTLQNYGVEIPLQSKVVQNKSKNTCKQKYGVEYSTQIESMKEKSIKTCLKKYGVNNAAESQEVKDKIVQTWLQKYGVKNIMELEYFRNKILTSFSQNGTAPTSSMQIKLSNIIKDIYGEDRVKDNVPCGKCLLDIELIYNDCKIDIEYDGYYWHKDKQERDKRRNYYVKNKGYKILRIRSNYEMPTSQQIIQGIDYLVKDNHFLKYIDLDI